MTIKEEVQFDLSDYHYSILNEDSLVVLTWIERSGLATCVEISHDLNMEESAVGSIVSKLLKTQLLQFYNGFMQPSEKGKYIIDKFQTFHEIITHAFPFQEMTPSEDDAIRNTLLLYRKNHYASYLFTLNSLKVWRRLSKAMNYDGSLLKEFIVSILIYDLRKASHGIGMLNEKPLYFSLQYYDVPTEEMGLINKAIQHLKLFNALLSTKDFGKYEAPERAFYEYLYGKDLFFADKVQTELIHDLYDWEKLGIDQVFYDHFSRWKKAFLGEKDYLLVEVESPHLFKGPKEEIPKLKTSFTVSELALMVRLYIDAGIITDVSPGKVMMFVTNSLTTKKTDALSAGSFRTNYYKPKLVTIRNCKRWLIKLQNKLGEYVNE